MNEIAPKAVAGLTLIGALLLLSTSASPFTDTHAGLTAAKAMGAALFWTTACAGLGTALFPSASAVEKFAAGLGLYGLILGVFCQFFGVLPMALTFWGLLGIGLWITKPRAPLPDIPPLVLILVGVLLGIGLLDALSPALDTDEIYQHLALPHQFLLEGHLLHGELNPDASRPLPVHMVYTGLMALGDVNAPKVFHLFLSGILLFSLWEISERRIGEKSGIPCILLLIGSYSFVREIGLAYNNLPVALWCLLALDNALSDSPKKMALFSGMALAAKYTAAPVVVGIYLAWLMQHGLKAIPSLMKWTAVALLLVAPWWLRNSIDGLHPLFPYAGWDSETAQFMMLEKYGMGREGLDFLLLPWNLSIHADPHSFVFLGRVSPAGILFLPAALVFGLRKHKQLTLVALVSFVGWALGPHWVRYLLPAAPILALTLVSGYCRLPRFAQWSLIALILLGLPRNWGPWLEDLAQRAPAATNNTAAETLVNQKIRGWEAVDWINQNSPNEAKVALLYAWPKLYIERSVV